MTQEQRGKLIRAATRIETVIEGYEKHRYLSSWEDQQLQHMREVRELINQVLGV